MKLIILGLCAFIGVVYSSPFSENDYFMLKAAQIEHQTELIRLAEERKLKDMCFKTAGNNDAYNNVKEAENELKVCVKLTVNEVVLDYVRKQLSNNQFYYSRPESTMQVVDVAKGLCGRKSDIRQCKKKLEVAYEKCLDDKKKAKLAKKEEDARKITDYICYNDAERVQNFVDNGGMQCLQANLNGFVECAHNSLSADVSSIINPSVLNDFETDQVQHCKNTSKFFNCLVEKMKTCSNKTPVNLIRDTFDYILKLDECDEVTNKTRIE